MNITSFPGECLPWGSTCFVFSWFRFSTQRIWFGATTWAPRGELAGPRVLLLQQRGHSRQAVPETLPQTNRHPRLGECPSK